MSKLNSGDIAIYTGQKVIIDNTHNVQIIESYKELTLVKATVFVSTRKLELIENKMTYSESKRYKLQQAIKATGFHAEKLSLATGKAKNYFVGITAESRFIKHGDITEERLNSLLTTLALSERELLGVGAKTVDDNNVSVPSIVIINTNQNSIAEHIEMLESNKVFEKYLSSKKTAIKDKKDAKVKNFLIVFLIFIVILSIYFLTR